jgi:hypothetical protein
MRHAAGPPLQRFAVRFGAIDIKISSLRLRQNPARCASRQSASSACLASKTPFESVSPNSAKTSNSLSPHCASLLNPARFQTSEIEWNHLLTTSSEWVPVYVLRGYL